MTTAQRPETVKDLFDTLYNHPDIGVTLEVKGAIQDLIDADKLAFEDHLLHSRLEDIRQQIYARNRSKPPDPIATLFGALAGQTGNPIEAALQYIEGLQGLHGRQATG